MKVIGSVKEDLSLEKRISITPETTKKFTGLGFTVNLEKGYAEHLDLNDAFNIVNKSDFVFINKRSFIDVYISKKRALKMLETHNNGIGLVITCDLEPAEFYCESLKSKGLTSTIEPES